MKTKADVLRIAKQELGYMERPAGSNMTKYGKWYGLDGNPWCMMFIQWVFTQAGFNLYKTASCTELMQRYKSRSPKQWKTWGFKEGDILIYDFSGKKKNACHCGICLTTDPIACTVTAIEGNTSTSSNDNGGIVMTRCRSVRSVIGAIRPNYPD